MLQRFDSELIQTEPISTFRIFLFEDYKNNFYHYCGCRITSLCGSRRISYTDQTTGLKFFGHVKTRGRKEFDTHGNMNRVTCTTFLTYERLTCDLEKPSFQP